MTIIIDEAIAKHIKSKGGKITQLRQHIILLLQNNQSLVSADDIEKHLISINLRKNKSTLYREFLFLCKHNIVQKIVINNQDFYELSYLNHLHLICTNCQSVSYVSIEDKVDKKNFLSNHGFKAKNSLTNIYGECKKCSD